MPRGGLIAGGGKIVHQFNVATNAVRGTLARHDDIAPGDVFLSNDPHNGGGLHPQDVFVLRPVFVDGRARRLGRQLCAHDGHRRHGAGLVLAERHRLLPGVGPSATRAARPRAASSSATCGRCC